MKLRFVLGAAGVAALLASAALAATTGGLWSTLPTVASAFGLSGNELVPADTELPQGIQPQTEIISTTQLRALNYSQQTPLTGFAIVVPANVGMLQLTPAGTLATGAITLPPSPVDGQQFCVFDTQIQSAVTFAASTGQTINGTAITAEASANWKVCYMFAGSTTNAGTANAWYRVQ
jgi:hypothetical protein